MNNPEPEHSPPKEVEESHRSFSAGRLSLLDAELEENEAKLKENAMLADARSEEKQVPEANEKVEDVTSPEQRLESVREQIDGRIQVLEKERELRQTRTVLDEKMEQEVLSGRSQKSAGSLRLSAHTLKGSEASKSKQGQMTEALSNAAGSEPMKMARHQSSSSGSSKRQSPELNRQGTQSRGLQESQSNASMPQASGIGIQRISIRTFVSPSQHPESEGNASARSGKFKHHDIGKVGPRQVSNGGDSQHSPISGQIGHFEKVNEILNKQFLTRSKGAKKQAASNQGSARHSSTDSQPAKELSEFEKDLKSFKRMSKKLMDLEAQRQTEIIKSTSTHHTSQASKHQQKRPKNFSPVLPELKVHKKLSMAASGKSIQRNGGHLDSQDEYLINGKHQKIADDIRKCASNIEKIERKMNKTKQDFAPAYPSHGSAVPEKPKNKEFN